MVVYLHYFSADNTKMSAISMAQIEARYVKFVHFKECNLEKRFYENESVEKRANRMRLSQGKKLISKLVRSP